MEDDETGALAVPHHRPWGTRIWLTAAAFLVVVLLAALPGSADAATGPHIVRADGDCLRMRSTPGLSGVMLACLAEGSQVFALGETVDADGLRWERVSAGGQTGWVAGIYIVPGTVSTPVPTPAAPVPTAIPTAPPAPAGGTINGAISTGGGFSLVLWTGGRIEALVAVAESRGCGVKSVWVSRSGGLIAYIAGAPSFVNEPWNNQVGTGVLGETPVIIVCATTGVSAGPAPTPVPTGPTVPVATPTPAPPTGSSPGANFPRNIPPGPAGNE
jgi:hypothetical protein